MGILGNALSRLIDNGERQALSLLSDAQRAFDNFDFDATVDSIMESGKGAFDTFNDFMKNIKDTVSDLKVIVQFDEKKEDYSIDVKDGLLKVVVKGKKGKSLKKTTTTIPSNCIIDEMTHYVDSKRGNLVVVIPKNVAEDENIKKLKTTITEKANGTATWLKNALKERAEAVAASTTAPTSSGKGTRRMPPHTRVHVTRGKDGKFVAKNPKAKKS